MITKQISIQNYDQLHEISKLKEISPDLILVFGSPDWFTEEIKLVDSLKTNFPNAIRVGCSTAGEISGSGVSNQSLVVTAVHFKNIKMQIESVDIATMKDSEIAGQMLAKKFDPSIQAFMVFSPGVDINGSALIQGLRSVLSSDIPITGGLAGDNAKFEKTYTLYQERISSRQIVGLAFKGTHLGFYHGSFGGWQSFGPARKVTKCEDNILFELDGEPALQVYKNYLGDHAARLPASGLLFPFAILNEDLSESGMIRTILGIDEAKGSLILAGDVALSSKLKLMHASTDKLVEGAEQAAELAINGNSTPSAGLILLVSCIGRKIVMGDRIDEETEAVLQVFPQGSVQVGFYSYGEISPLSGTTNCQLHNQTMTVTYLTEIE